jgi:hypothetical protein
MPEAPVNEHSKASACEGNVDMDVDSRYPHEEVLAEAEAPSM